MATSREANRSLPFGLPQTMSAGADQLDLFKLLRQTRLEELVLTRVPVLAPTQTVAEAAAAMREVSHGSAVIAEGGRIIGILTERDLLRIASGPEEGFEAPVGLVMTRQPKTVSLQDTLCDAVRWMDQGGYRRLPVVDAEGTPCGIVDVKTILTFIVEQMPTTVYNQASRRLLTVTGREGA